MACRPRFVQGVRSSLVVEKGPDVPVATAVACTTQDVTGYGMRRRPGGGGVRLSARAHQCDKAAEGTAQLQTDGESRATWAGRGGTGRYRRGARLFGDRFARRPDSRHPRGRRRVRFRRDRCFEQRVHGGRFESVRTAQLAGGLDGQSERTCQRHRRCGLRGHGVRCRGRGRRRQQLRGEKPS